VLFGLLGVEGRAVQELELDQVEVVQVQRHGGVDHVPHLSAPLHSTVTNQCIVLDYSRQYCFAAQVQELELDELQRLGGVDMCHTSVLPCTVQNSAVLYSTVQYSTVQCSSVQYRTVHYRTAHWHSSGDKLSPTIALRPERIH